MKLSKTQQELLDAMKAGAVCHFMSNAGNAYYFRSDTMKRCTAAADALSKKGLVKQIKKNWRGHELAHL